MQLFGRYPKYKGKKISFLHAINQSLRLELNELAHPGSPDRFHVSGRKFDHKKILLECHALAPERRLHP